MSQAGLTTNVVADVALRLAKRTVYLLFLAAIFISAGWFVAFPVPGLVLILVGLSFLFVVLIAQVIVAARRRGHNRLFKAASRFLNKDASPAFATDDEGGVLYQNDAALERFGDKKGQAFAGVLQDLFASPEAVLYRLQNKATALGSAHEDVVVRRGHLRFSVNGVGQGVFFWRLDELNTRPVGTRNGEHISLPMMTVSQSGTILFMNEAARCLLGGREKTLDRVFAELPVQAGSVVSVSAKDGPVEHLISEVDITGGRREIYFLPPGPKPLITGQEWAFIDGLPVPLIRLNEGGQITMANRRARALLGDEDPVGTPLADLVEGLGRPVSEWLREAHSGHHIGHSEVVRAIKPEDDVFMQISLGQVADDKGKALVAVLQDATELKTLEAQFVQSQKMEAIGQLAGGVAHDFNNLLTAISGHCDLLLLGRKQEDPEYSDLSQIHQNANRAAALVRQLLAFSRKQTLRPEKLILTESLSDLTHLLNRLVGETVSLELDHDPDLRTIRADRRQLDQVIMNLVVNARDAMKDGGGIKIETRNVTIEQALQRDRATVPAGDYVTIRVIDHGDGISADKITKIFEPFYTTKAAGKGTGLGLSMAYGIVKQMGGYIFADSIPGKGSTFTLYFPVLEHNDAADVTDGLAYVMTNSAAQQDDEPAQEDGGETSAVKSAEADLDADIRSTLAALNSDDQLIMNKDGTSVHRAPPKTIPKTSFLSPPPSDKRVVEAKQEHGAQNLSGSADEIVLLVEDEAPVRAFASRALRMRGYTVLEAENAEEALRTLEDRSLEVDIFVTDVVMPGMDGPTWVSKALKDRPGVKVVFVSGYAEDSVSEHQSRIPNSVFLPKPFSLTDLTATVQRQLH